MPLSKGYPLMIEFKGVYHRQRGKYQEAVLVQFDDVLIHVWHLSDPFYRLLSSDLFRLPFSLSKGRRCIKLPNGDRIETDDQDALAQIRKQSLSLSENYFSGRLIHRWVVALVGITLIILGMCWVLN
jgi:hypothetical protein